MATLLLGWHEIAKFLRVSERWARARRLQLLEAKVIFYRKRQGKKRIVCAFDNDLQRWAGNWFELEIQQP
jgi:hypothetical protein